MLPDLASDQPALYTPLGLFAAWDRRIAALLNEVRGRARTGVSAPEEIVDVRQALDAMRLVKDAHEQRPDAPRRRHFVGRAPPRDGAHAARLVRVPGRGRAGARVPARAARRRSPTRSIVAGGPNACVLHYRDNNRQLADGELLLIDAGCEYQSYASDITRTFPVNGRFTGPQRDVYELVLAAQQACIDAVSPGVDFHDYHKVAERVLAQGYIDLGLCTGTLDEVLESGSYKQFYMHRAGHWLGLDVHDAGLYQVKGASQKLAAGHGADRRAGHLHPPRRQRPRAVLEHRRAHRGRRARHRGRHREPDRGGAEDPSPTSKPRAGADRPRCADAARRRHRRRRPGRRDARARARRRRPRRGRARRARAGARRCAATARSRCRTARG